MAAIGWAAPPHPLLLEINTWPWLDELGTAAGRPIDLGSVPERCWDDIAGDGFDAVWLMGVWQRSPAGIARALADPDLLASFAAALPDHRADDVVGSPYCIRDYVVDERLGGPAGLAAARQALAQRGIGLVLDFVPNHVAPDHPWTTAHPERFVGGDADDLRADPASFTEIGGRVLANGRDPFFPAWPDVIQLDAFAPGLRAAALDTLRDIADQCDGVRCDMAMLLLNDTFQRSWGGRAAARPEDEYWAAVIPEVRRTHPGFLFIAEAYWDLEWALQQLGFDHCYDKRLYDRLLSGSPGEVRQHLLADDAYQQRLLRFLENHDEPRAAAILDPAREKALAVATLTQTGARLVHHGQAEGRKVRLPVFLGRFPEEDRDEDLADFHRSLLAVLRDPTFHQGRWQLCEVSGWEGNDRASNLVAWGWDGSTRWLITCNLSDSGAAAHVAVPWEDLRGLTCRLRDDTNDLTLERAGSDLRDGLYVELPAWGWHLFRIDPLEGP